MQFRLENNSWKKWEEEKNNNSPLFKLIWRVCIEIYSTTVAEKKNRIILTASQPSSMNCTSFPICGIKSFEVPNGTLCIAYLTKYVQFFLLFRWFSMERIFNQPTNSIFVKFCTLCKAHVIYFSSALQGYNLEHFSRWQIVGSQLIINV